MEVAIHLPDDIAQHVQAHWEDVPRAIRVRGSSDSVSRFAVPWFPHTLTHRSAWALMPSPIRMKPAVMSMSAAPGKKDIHHWPETIYGLPSLIITPHSSVGGCTPSPMKLKPAALRMAQDRFIVDCVTIGPRALGKRWRKISRVSEQPMAVPTMTAGPTAMVAMNRSKRPPGTPLQPPTQRHLSPFGIEPLL